MITWKEIAEKLTNEFMAWGCRFSRKQLPEIAMGYDCTPLFYWNWQDGEVEQSEKVGIQEQNAEKTFYVVKQRTEYVSSVSSKMFIHFFLPSTLKRVRKLRP